MEPATLSGSSNNASTACVASALAVSQNVSTTRVESRGFARMPVGLRDLEIDESPIQQPNRVCGAAGLECM